MEGGLSKEKTMVRWAVHEQRRALRGDSEDISLTTTKSDEMEAPEETA